MTRGIPRFGTTAGLLRRVVGFSYDDREIARLAARQHTIVLLDAIDAAPTRSDQHEAAASVVERVVLVAMRRARRRDARRAGR